MSDKITKVVFNLSDFRCASNYAKSKLVLSSFYALPAKVDFLDSSSEIICPSSSTLSIIFSQFHIVAVLDISQSYFAVNSNGLQTASTIDSLKNLLQQLYLHICNSEKSLVYLTILLSVSDLKQCNCVWQGIVCPTLNTNDLINEVQRNISLKERLRGNSSQSNYPKFKEFPDLNFLLHSAQLHIDSYLPESCPVIILITSGALKIDLLTSQQLLCSKLISFHVLLLPIQSSDCQIGLLPDVTTLTILSKTTNGLLCRLPNKQSDNSSIFETFVEQLFTRVFYYPEHDYQLKASVGKYARKQENAKVNNTPSTLEQDSGNKVPTNNHTSGNLGIEPATQGLHSVCLQKYQLFDIPLDIYLSKRFAEGFRITAIWFSIDNSTTASFTSSLAHISKQSSKSYFSKLRLERSCSSISTLVIEITFTMKYVNPVNPKLINVTIYRQTSLPYAAYRQNIPDSIHSLSDSVIEFDLMVASKIYCSETLLFLTVLNTQYNQNINFAPKAFTRNNNNLGIEQFYSTAAVFNQLVSLVTLVERGSSQIYTHMTPAYLIPTTATTTTMITTNNTATRSLYSVFSLNITMTLRKKFVTALPPDWEVYPVEPLKWLIFNSSPNDLTIWVLHFAQVHNCFLTAKSLCIGANAEQKRLRRLLFGIMLNVLSSHGFLVIPLERNISVMGLSAENVYFSSLEDSLTVTSHRVTCQFFDDWLTKALLSELRHTKYMLGFRCIYDHMIDGTVLCKLFSHSTPLLSSTLSSSWHSLIQCRIEEKDGYVTVTYFIEPRDKSYTLCASSLQQEQANNINALVNEMMIQDDEIFKAYSLIYVLCKTYALFVTSESASSDDRNLTGVLPVPRLTEQSSLTLSEPSLTRSPSKSKQQHFTNSVKSNLENSPVNPVPSPKANKPSVQHLMIGGDMMVDNKGLITIEAWNIAKRLGENNRMQLQLPVFHHSNLDSSTSSNINLMLLHALKKDLGDFRLLHVAESTLDSSKREWLYRGYIVINTALFFIEFDASILTSHNMTINPSSSTVVVNGKHALRILNADNDDNSDDKREHPHFTLYAWFVPIPLLSWHTAQSLTSLLHELSCCSANSSTAAATVSSTSASTSSKGITSNTSFGKVENVRLSEKVASQLPDILNKIYRRHLNNLPLLFYSVLLKYQEPIVADYRVDIPLVIAQCQMLYHEVDLSIMCKIKSTVLASVPNASSNMREILEQSFKDTLGKLCISIPNTSYYILNPFVFDDTIADVSSSSTEANKLLLGTEEIPNNNPMLLNTCNFMKFAILGRSEGSVAPIKSISIESSADLLSASLLTCCRCCEESPSNHHQLIHENNSSSSSTSTSSFPFSTSSFADDTVLRLEYYFTSKETENKETGKDNNTSSHGYQSTTKREVDRLHNILPNNYDTKGVGSTTSSNNHIFSTLKRQLEIFVATDTLDSLLLAPSISQEVLTLVQSCLSESNDVTRCQFTLDFLIPTTSTKRKAMTMPSEGQQSIFDYEAVTYFETELKRRLHMDKLGEILFTRGLTKEQCGIVTDRDGNGNGNGSEIIPCWLVLLTSQSAVNTPVGLLDGMSVLSMDISLSLRIRSMNEIISLMDINTRIINYLKDCSRLGNQQILLRQLYETGVVSAYLIKPADAPVKLEPVTQVRSSRRSSAAVPFSRTPSVPPTIAAAASIPAATSLTTPSTPTTSSTQSTNAATQDSIKWDRFTPGFFGCAVQAVIECSSQFLVLNAENIMRLLEEFSRLMPPNIADNCFITRDVEGSIYYMNFDFPSAALSNSNTTSTTTSTANNNGPSTNLPNERERERENIRSVSLILYGNKAPDERLIAGLRSTVQSVLDYLMAVTIAFQISRKAFHSSYLTFLKIGKSNQHEVNIPLPSYVHDRFLFACITRQVMLASQIFSNELFSFQYEKSGSTKSLSSVFHPACIGYNFNSTEIHLPSAALITPTHLHTNPHSHLPYHQPTSEKEDFIILGSKRQTHVEDTFPDLYHIRESPIFLGRYTSEKVVGSPDGQALRPMVNPNDFTFLYNFVPIRGGQSQDKAQTQDKLSKRRQIGTGFAVIELSVYPGVVVTGSKSSIQADLKSLFSRLASGERIRLRDSPTSSNTTADATSTADSSKDSNHGSPRVVRKYPSNSSSGSAHATTGIGIDSLGADRSRSSSAAASSSASYMKVCITPVIPMQTQALFDFIYECLEHALTIYCSERLCSAMEDTSIASSRNNSIIGNTLDTNHSIDSNTFLRKFHDLSVLQKLPGVGTTPCGYEHFPVVLPFPKASHLLKSVGQEVLLFFPALREFMRSEQCIPLFSDEMSPEIITQSTQWKSSVAMDTTCITSISFGNSFLSSLSSEVDLEKVTGNQPHPPTHVANNFLTSLGHQHDLRYLTDCDPFMIPSTYEGNASFLLKRKFFVEIAVDTSGIHIFYANASAVLIDKVRSICVTKVMVASDSNRQSAQLQLDRLGIKYEHVDAVQRTRKMSASFDLTKKLLFFEEIKKLEIELSKVHGYNFGGNGNYSNDTQPSEGWLLGQFIEIQIYLLWSIRTKWKVSSPKELPVSPSCLLNLPRVVWKNGIIIRSLFLPLPLVNDKSTSYSNYLDKLYRLALSNDYIYLPPPLQITEKNNEIHNNDTKSRDNSCVFIIPIPHTCTILASTIIVTEDTHFHESHIHIIHRVIDVADILYSGFARSDALLLKGVCLDDQLTQSMSCREFQWPIDNDDWLDSQNMVTTDIYTHPIMMNFEDRFILQSLSILYEFIVEHTYQRRMRLCTASATASLSLPPCANIRAIEVLSSVAQMAPSKISYTVSSLQISSFGELQKFHFSRPTAYQLFSFFANNDRTSTTAPQTSSCQPSHSFLRLPGAVEENHLEDVICLHYSTRATRPMMHNKENTVHNADMSFHTSNGHICSLVLLQIVSIDSVKVHTMICHERDLEMIGLHDDKYWVSDSKSVLNVIQQNDWTTLKDKSHSNSSTSEPVSNTSDIKLRANLPSSIDKHNNINSMQQVVDEKLSTFAEVISVTARPFHIVNGDDNLQKSILDLVKDSVAGWVREVESTTAWNALRNRVPKLSSGSGTSTASISNRRESCPPSLNQRISSPTSDDIMNSILYINPSQPLLFLDFLLPYLTTLFRHDNFMMFKSLLEKTYPKSLMVIIYSETSRRCMLSYEVYTSTTSSPTAVDYDFALFFSWKDDNKDYLESMKRSRGSSSSSDREGISMIDRNPLEIHNSFLSGFISKIVEIALFTLSVAKL